MNEIWSQIKTEVDEFSTDYLPINPNYAPKQSDIIELVDYYWMSRFKEGDKDSTGFKKSFYNIILNPVDVASKLIDLDTKDILIKAENGQSYYPSWLYGKQLRLYMKEKKNQYKETFGQLLNRIVFNWPKYGHLILKKVQGTIYSVPIQNIVNRQDAESILSSDYLIEKHRLTYNQLRAMPYDPDLTEWCISKYGKDGMITIYERHGDCSCPMGHNYHIVAEGAQDDEILHHDTIDRDDLYRELKWDDIPARAMGRGQAERLFEAQIAKNQTENLFRAGLRWSSKHIFQTRDNTLAKNLINAIENGDVMMVNSEITPIAVEERNLHSYNFADQKWDKNIADISFAYSELSGERPPSGTPLGTSILQTQMSGQYFDIKQEALGLFLKDIIYDWVIPEFKKEKKGNLMLGEFDEEELDRLRGLLLKNRTNKKLVEFMGKTKRIPSSEEAKLIQSVIKEGLKTKKEIEIPADYYDDIKYKIDIIITNEQIDMASRLSTLQTILQIIGSNPMILQEPRTRKIFYKLLDLTGFSPIDFQLEETADISETMMQSPLAQRGGSIARPMPIGTPAMLPAATRL